MKQTGVEADQRAADAGQCAADASRSCEPCEPDESCKPCEPCDSVAPCEPCEPVTPSELCMEQLCLAQACPPEARSPACPGAPTSACAPPCALEATFDLDLEAQCAGRRRGARAWLAETVDADGMVPSLVVQALATGLLDATTYADFQTYASNQTGNLILLCLSAVGTTRVLLLLTGVSLASFLSGAFVGGQLGHVLGVRRRAWLLLSTAAQILLLLAATLVLALAPTPLTGALQPLPLALLALLSGLQVALARQSSVAELPTAPMTSSLVDFVADSALFTGWRSARATGRNRRALYIGAMVGGALAGAGVQRQVGSAAVCALGIAVKVGVLVGLGLAPAERPAQRA